MAKKIIQDVVPPGQRSIRNIPLPESRKVRANDLSKKLDSKDSRNKKPLSALRASTGKNHSSVGLWIVAFICLVVLGFSFSFLFTSAKVKITPRFEKIATNQSISAVKDETGESLQFEIITLSKNGGRVVSATGEERADIKASGKIMIYNKHSKNPQVLVKNTRFQTPDGLIFKIVATVIVPGATTTDDGTNTPGSVEAEVIADASGEKYNIGLSDFTIPGFKGDLKFTNFYARSVTIMAGGFSGIVKKIPDTVLNQTVVEIQNELKEKLKNNARNQIPADYIIFDDGFFFKSEALPQTDITRDSVQVNVRTTVHGIMWSRFALQKAILQKMFPPQTDISIIQIRNLNLLKLEIQNKQSVNPESMESINFTIQGEAELIWTYDKTQLGEDLTGKTKKSLEEVLKAYPGVKKANAVVMPFWKKTFPSNSKKINIEDVPI